MACLVPEDCTRACEEECATLKVKQHCGQECTSICRATCLKKGGAGVEECAEACQENCHPKCARSKADQLLMQRERCEVRQPSPLLTTNPSSF